MDSGESSDSGEAFPLDTASFASPDDAWEEEDTGRDGLFPSDSGLDLDTGASDVGDECARWGTDTAAGGIPDSSNPWIRVGVMTGCGEDTATVTSDTGTASLPDVEEPPDLPPLEEPPNAPFG